MAAPDLVNLSGLMDDAKCFAFVRQQRWPEGVHCPAWFKNCHFQVTPQIDRTLLVKGFLVLGVTLI